MTKEASPWGEITHLSIKWNDRRPVHDWRDLQRIKDELVGPDIEAVEIYPASHRLVDSANQYHLWCLPMGMIVPCGYMERLVSNQSSHGSVQRPFPLDWTPNDLVEFDPDDHLPTPASTAKALRVAMAKDANVIAIEVAHFGKAVIVRVRGWAENYPDNFHGRAVRISVEGEKSEEAKA